MHRGYLTPPVIFGLAIICFGVAATLFFHSYLIRESKKEPTPSPIVSPSPVDETANWETYTNGKHDYQIRFPTGKFILREVTEYDYHQITIRTTGCTAGKRSEDCPSELSVTINYNPTITDLDKEFEDAKENCTFKDSRSKLDKTTFLGYKAIYSEVFYDSDLFDGVCKDSFYELNAHFFEKRISFLKDGYKFSLNTTLPINSTEREIIQPEFDQILSTFKFLE